MRRTAALCYEDRGSRLAPYRHTGSLTIVAEFKNLDAKRWPHVCVDAQESCRLLCIGKRYMENQSDTGGATLGMGLNPAMGGEVHGDAGGEKAQTDCQCSDDPVELDMAFEEAEIEDAEDQHQNGCFREEGRTAA